MRWVTWFKLVIVTSIVSLSSIGIASDNSKNNVKPQPVVIGIYVTDIFGADISHKTVDVAFWLWVIYKDKSLNPLKYLDIVNAESVKQIHSEIMNLDNGSYWAGGKYHAKLHQNWDFDSYPLDDQSIEFVFEDTRNNADKLIFIVDNEQSNIDLQVAINGWIITNNYWKQHIYDYKSNFGLDNPEDKDSLRYARATYKIELERKGFRKLIQVFGVAYLACFLALCIYFLPLGELRGRLGLITGAIFALVGNKLLTDSYLPAATGLTLVDQVQLVSMVFLAVTILMTVIIYYFSHHQRTKLARTINTICTLLAIILVPGIQATLLLTHYHY
ncbi:hypothetical protein L3V79_00355 [Thiotrichales bacterium 19S9-12]|nr:hypothetical protein [Thiotrichales bacterium 19S9-11]MCF6810818.1 hypothetical protein [Thiotrichales bacterium 19S9-12]